MYCITRHELKFGEIVVPARTECQVIWVSSDVVDAPGVQLTATIPFFKLGMKEIKNKIIIKDKFGNSYGSQVIQTGITIHTNTKAVYMFANSEMYWYKKLYKWQVEKIFPDGIPNQVVKEKNGELIYPLAAVIEYLEDQLTDWVRQNCEFRTVAEEELENGAYPSYWEPGVTVLTNRGSIAYEAKKLEIQNRLEEATGFTYNFKGGLIWE